MIVPSSALCLRNPRSTKLFVFNPIPKSAAVFFRPLFCLCHLTPIKVCKGAALSEMRGKAPKVFTSKSSLPEALLKVQLVNCAFEGASRDDNIPGGRLWKVRPFH